MSRLISLFACAWLALLAPLSAHAGEVPVCTLLAQHAGWSEAVRAAAARWDVPPSLLLAVVRQESNFRTDPRHPDTAAPYGYPQAIRATWVNYTKSSGRPDAHRNDFAASVDFIGWYLSGARERVGVSYANTTAHYLAYSRGPFAVGPASLAARRNAARVSAYAAAYERDLRACPVAATTLSMAELPG